MSCVPARLVFCAGLPCLFALRRTVPKFCWQFGATCTIIVHYCIYHFKGRLFVRCAKACQFEASGYDFGSVRWSDSLSDLRADVLSLLLIASQFVTTDFRNLVSVKQSKSLTLSNHKKMLAACKVFSRRIIAVPNMLFGQSGWKVPLKAIQTESAWYDSLITDQSDHWSLNFVPNCAHSQSDELWPSVHVWLDVFAGVQPLMSIGRILRTRWQSCFMYFYVSTNDHCIVLSVFGRLGRPIWD